MSTHIKEEINGKKIDEKDKEKE